MQKFTLRNCRRDWRPPHPPCHLSPATSLLPAQILTLQPLAIHYSGRPIGATAERTRTAPATSSSPVFSYGQRILCGLAQLVCVPSPSVDSEAKFYGRRRRHPTGTCMIELLQYYCSQSPRQKFHFYVLQISQVFFWGIWWRFTYTTNQVHALCCKALLHCTHLYDTNYDWLD